MIKSFLFLLVCFSTSLFSAGPMFHLYVAERFCEIEGIADPHVLQELLVGTEFPDIRYITHAARDLTHPQIWDIRKVALGSTPFEVGMKLHAWVDLVREAHIDPEVYEAIAPYAEGHLATLLKMIEEEILADFYDGRQWSPLFDSVLPEQLTFANEEAVRKWHRIIQWTMALRPSWYLWGQSFRGPALGISVDTLYNWSYLLPELKEKPLFREHVHSLLAHIEEELRRMFLSNPAHFLLLYSETIIHVSDGVASTTR